MQVKDISVELREHITEAFFFGVCSIEYTDSDSLMAKGIVDSTGVLELITFVEENYGIEVADDELLPENLDSISNLVEFIIRKANND